MAIDWTRSMQQTFEFYEVDPGTWRNKRLVTTIISCTISRELNSDLLGSASINCEEPLDECYIRVYLICTQDRVTYKFPLGTFLVQTPSSSFTGTHREHSVEAYSPLLELRDAKPPYGYAIMKGANIMDTAYQLASENLRAPVVKARSNITIPSDFVSDFDNDNWLTYLSDFIANARFSFSEDEMGNILFAPEQQLAALQPVWTFSDDNSSIILPDVSFERDLYGVPNVVEVLCSADNFVRFSRQVNDDVNSPISIQNRGREIVYRQSNPSTLVRPTQAELDRYARQLLESMSAFEYSVNYKHGYCPVRLGDCVRLDYIRAGLKNVKAKVVSQSIDCKTGCIVNERAVYTKKLWEE